MIFEATRKLSGILTLAAQSLCMVANLFLARGLSWMGREDLHRSKNSA